MIVYCLHNRVTGKRYIGVTTMPLATRWYQHVWRAENGRDTVLSQAIRKHGKDAFDVSTVASALPGSSIEALFNLERAVIAQERTKCPVGYNMTDGGDGTIGYVYTPEQCAARARRKHSAETRAKMSAARKGRPCHTAQSRAKISAANKKLIGRTPWNKGGQFSEITKAKMSAAWTPERRAAQAEIMSARRRSAA